MPVGVYILGVVNLLLGAWFLFGYLTMLLPLLIAGGFDPLSSWGLGGAFYFAFYLLAMLGDIVVSGLMVVSGLGLLRKRWQRAATVVKWTLAVAGVSVVFAGLGALLGWSASFLFFEVSFFLGIALVLLVPTTLGAWYLGRPSIRRAMAAERERKQVAVAAGAAADRPRE